MHLESTLKSMIESEVTTCNTMNVGKEEYFSIISKISELRNILKPYEKYSNDL